MYFVTLIAKDIGTAIPEYGAQREGMMVQHMDSGLGSVAADVGQQGAQRLCIICIIYVCACKSCT